MASSRTRVDAVIIGGGVVGTAVATELTRRFESVVLLEAGPRLGEGISSRNSGVIHAGLYYSKNSLKSELCISGQEYLYEWCKVQEVPHARLGKWIIAQPGEEGWLEALNKNAIECGAKGIGPILSKEKTDLDDVHFKVAFFSESTGIVDAAELVQSFSKDAELRGLLIFKQAGATRIERAVNEFEVHTSSIDTGILVTPIVVNAAGLEADRVAKLVGVEKYELFPCRGDYFKLRTNRRFKNLIYPVKVPGAPGLGIHITVDLGGAVKLGPDAEYVHSRDDFSLSELEVERKIKKFAKAVSRYLPSIDARDLFYDTCGIRPKLNPKKDEDFVISQDLPGFINLLGIESPGLTSSLSIAKRVAKML